MLRRYIQSAAPSPSPQETCELCSEPIPPEHRHLLDVSTRQVLCVCRACSILFAKEAASEGKYRLIPDRHLALDDFAMSDAEWESLRIPVGMAFFTYSTPASKVVAFYPSPMGQTESLLPLTTWTELEQRNPILRTMERDVEALLVNRARDARQYFLVPIDDCFRLAAVIRLHWRGLSGGSLVRRELDRFFEQLQQSSTPTLHAD